jgi:hypothetical protein
MAGFFISPAGFAGPSCSLVKLVESHNKRQEIMDGMEVLIHLEK